MNSTSGLLADSDPTALTGDTQVEPDHYLTGLDQRRGAGPDLMRVRRSVARRSVLCQADHDGVGRNPGQRHEGRQRYEA